MSDRYQALQTARIAALKGGDRTRKDGLTLIVNEANMIGKNSVPPREPTDDDVIQALNRTIKKARETRDILLGRDPAADTALQDGEIALATEFLPTQMTSEILEAKIATLLEATDRGKSARGFVMKALNADHKGEFDSKSANDILGRLLA